jgi:hypothetical protein
MSAAISVDNAASGFLRHRFVRAISASWLVLTVVVLLGLIAWAIYDEARENATEMGILLIAGPIVLVMFMGGLAIVTGLSAAVADAMHRRLVAFIALSVLAPSIAIFIFGGIGIAGQGLGILEQGGEDDIVLPIWQLWMLAAVLVISLLIALEALGWAWWQMTTSRAGFFAARGWRPPLWRVSSALRRVVGLPAYISNFGRGRLGLTLIYFVAAIVNLGLIAILLVPLMLFGMDEGQPDAIQYFGIAMGFAALVVLNFLGVGVLLDRIADARATKLYQDVREWDARAPIVFLRAFNQDDEKLPARTRDPVVRFPAGVGSARTLDEILLEHGS